MAQKYTAWELILVDDGSKDASAGICDRYASEDSRIRAIHKPNGGAASARNAGLDAATGEFVTFIDADDYVSSDLLSDYIGAGDSDLIISGYNMLWDNQSKTVKPSEANMHGQNEIVKYMCMDDRILVGSSCNKLYRRQLLEEHSIRFPETLRDISEDHIFNWTYFAVCRNARGIARSNYNYIENRNSLTHRSDPKGKEPIEARLDFMTELFDRMEAIADNNLKSLAMGSYYNYFSDTILRSIYLYGLDGKTREELLGRFNRLINRSESGKLRSAHGMFNKIIAIPLYLPRTFSDILLLTIFKTKRLFYRG